MISFTKLDQYVCLFRKIFLIEIKRTTSNCPQNRKWANRHRQLDNRKKTVKVTLKVKDFKKKNNPNLLYSTKSAKQSYIVE